MIFNNFNMEKEERQQNRNKVSFDQKNTHRYNHSTLHRN